MKWYGRWTLTGVLYVQQAVGFQSESQVHVMSDIWKNFHRYWWYVWHSEDYMHKSRTPGFLKLILSESFVCMFVPTPEAINN